MTFGQPLWFWALLILPVLVALFLRNERQRWELLQKLVAARLAEKLSGTASPTKRRVRFGLLLLGLICVIVSAAQPRLGYTWQERKTRGRDVIVAIDVSRSMLANDLAPNRLTRAKLAAEDLIGQLGGDRVGVIAFAGTAFLQAPLTADHSAALGALHETDPEVIPRGGTNIAEAIRMAVEAFGKGESDNRALVIFTDGEELDADGIKVAREQKEIARIFTIGIGSAEGAIIALPGHFGATEYVKDPQGQIVKSRLDEDRLRAIAEATGGFYLRLQNGPAEMRQLIRDGFSVMNEKDLSADFAHLPVERYQWPLAAGIFLLVTSFLIGERRRGPVRRPLRAGLSKGVALIASLLLSQATVLQAQTPEQLYEEGKYKEAQQAYEELLRRNPGSDLLAFNHGAAAYRNRDFKAALESFGKALTTRDPQLRARAEYNLANTLFQQGVAGKKQPDIETLKSALAHYDEARKLNPKSEDAQYNYDVTKKLIEVVEQKQQEQQQQQQENKDQQEKEQKDQKDDKQESKEGEEKKDQQQKGGKPKNSETKPGDPKDQEQQQEQGEDGEPKDEKSEPGKEGEKKEESPGKDGEKKKDAQSGSEERTEQQKADDAKKEQEGKKGEQPDPSKDQPSRKLQGDLQTDPVPGEESKEAQEQREAAEEALAAAEGRMTEAQAKALLDSLKSEDRNVRLWDAQGRRRERPVRDW